MLSSFRTLTKNLVWSGESNHCTYDSANRLTSVNGVTYTWDANGNLLNDGESAYTYNHANRLISISGPPSSVSFAYNGFGDRMQQTVDGVTSNYTLDTAIGLTQVLADAENTYLYGLARIAQLNTDPLKTEYFLGDALGSVRQLTDESGVVTMVKEYQPYGDVMSSAGDGVSSYGFTGEWMDATGMVYLRARYYFPWDGRFMTRDAWAGDYNSPMSYNGWLYGYANPIMMTDPSGMIPLPQDPCDRLPPNDAYWCRKARECVETPKYDQQVDHVNLSAYFTLLESDYYGEKVPVKTNEALQRITGGAYLLKDAFNATTNYVNSAQEARSNFLYGSDGLCMQGSGKLENGMYVSCTDRCDNIIGFEWLFEDAAAASQHIVALETAARCPWNSLTPFRRGDKVEIPALTSIMRSWGKDEFFTVTDTGGGLCKDTNTGHPDTLDIYIGEGRYAYNNYANDLIKFNDVTVYIYRNTGP